MSNAWKRKYNTKPFSQNSTQIVNCAPCRAEPCLQENSEALLKVYNRRMYNYVRVPSSLYTGTLGGSNTFNGSLGGVYGLRWNQSSDKKLAHIGTAIVPTRGNSTRTSVTRDRPGAGSPGGVGVDIKHNSFQRYLNRKKGATVPSGPYVGAQVNPKSVTNNKVQKSSIITTKNTIDCVCNEDVFNN